MKNLSIAFTSLLLVFVWTACDRGASRPDIKVEVVPTYTGARRGDLFWLSVDIPHYNVGQPATVEEIVKSVDIPADEVAKFFPEGVSHFSGEVQILTNATEVTFTAVDGRIAGVGRRQKGAIRDDR